LLNYYSKIAIARQALLHLLPSPAETVILFAICPILINSNGEGMHKCIRQIYWLLLIVAASAWPTQAEEQVHNAWVESGWEQLELDKPQQAMQLWQQGMNSQPDSRLFAVLGVYQLQENALHQLYRVGRSHLTFIIHTAQSAPQRYIVLSARDVAADWPLRQQQLADLKQAAAIESTLLAKSAQALKHEVVAAEVKQPIDAPSSVTPPHWLTRGWEQIDIYDIDRAMQIWQIGLNELQDKRLLVSLGVFAKQENAVARIKQLGREQLVFIAIRHIGKPLYYVLSMRDVAADPALRQEDLAELKQIANITSRLLTMASVNFKNRLILEHYPELFSSKPVYIPNRESNRETAQPSPADQALPEEAGADLPVISRLEISGNQQVSTDTIILELREFFDMKNSSANRTRIRQSIVQLYHDIGLNHVSINIADAMHDGTVNIAIQED